MSDNQNPDVHAELAALRTEVERLRTREDETQEDNEWRGLKEYSKAIEEGRINEFLYDRSAPAWVQNIGVAYVFITCLAMFLFIYFSSNP